MTMENSSSSTELRPNFQPTYADAPVECSGIARRNPADLTADAMPLPQVLEAILFSTDIPLSAGKLAEIVGLDSTKPIKQTLEQLNRDYELHQAAFRIEERAGGYQLLTLPQYAKYIERLVKKKDEGRLTPAGLETLAIVAYKQPITAPASRRFVAWPAAKSCAP